MPVELTWSKLTVVLKSGASYEVYGEHEVLAHTLQFYQEHPICGGGTPGQVITIIKGKVKTPLLVDRWITVLRSEVAGMVLEEAPQFVYDLTVVEFPDSKVCPMCQGRKYIHDGSIRCPMCKGIGTVIS